jgi:hypothetical protein
MNCKTKEHRGLQTNFEFDISGTQEGQVTSVKSRRYPNKARESKRLSAYTICTTTSSNLAHYLNKGV